MKMILHQFHKIKSFLLNRSLRNKLFWFYGGTFILVSSLASVSIYFFVRTILVDRIEQELSNSIQAIKAMVETSARGSIINYLRATIELNKQNVSNYYGQYVSGKLSEEAAQELARSQLMCQTIGVSGYLYCLDSKGVMRVHPELLIQGSNLSSYAFIQQQLIQRKGYLEYDWKNPSDDVSRKKALYMDYFAPWDWIISASTYQAEFLSLLSVNDFKNILDIRFGESGYSFIISGKGEVFLHPKLNDKNFNLQSGREYAFVREMCRVKTGRIIYPWKNPDESQSRTKLVIFDYIPRYDWIVASSYYLDELWQPLVTIRWILGIALVLSLMLSLVVSYRLSRSILMPLYQLRDHAQTIAGLVPPVPDDRAGDEIQALTAHFTQLHEGIAQRMADLAQLNRQLQLTEENLQLVLDSTPTLLILVDPVMTIKSWNRAATLSTGIAAGEALGKSLFTLIPALEPIRDALIRFCQQGERFDEVRLKNGRLCYKVSVASLKQDLQGALIQIEDVTDIERKDQALRQAQKMETMSILAGGLAHDFNNWLGAIIGIVSLVEYELAENSSIPPAELAGFMDAIKKSALRSAEMVKQLLSLARTSEAAFLVTDLRTIIRNAEKLGYHSLDKTVRLSVSLPLDPALIFADPLQIEQVLLNFFINAAHAMTVMRPVDDSQGGVITVGLSQFEADEHFVTLHPHAQAIPYWCVSIRDSGVGMDAETQAHLFEPFFSTKPKGVGTGLGLTMAYNIFQRHQGFITVYSEKGNGSEFQLYLPVAHADQPREGDIDRHAIKQGTGLILIIDDEAVLLNTAARMLELCGYSVMRAQTGEEGLALFQKHHAHIVLVLLDLSLPSLSGKEIYPRLTAISPSVKVLLASGYKEDIRVAQLLSQGVQKFITKPYSLSMLAEAVAEVLKPA